MDLKTFMKLGIDLKEKLDSKVASRVGLGRSIVESPLGAGESICFEYLNFLTLGRRLLPDFEAYFMMAIQSWNRTTYKYASDARKVVEYVLKVLDLQVDANIEASEVRLFDSAHDKVQASALSFKSGDYDSSFNNLNSALELMLKEALGIPTTIASINTSNIIDVCVKEGIGPVEYLKQVKKLIVVPIDNKVKHQGYKADKIEALNAQKAVEDLEHQLRNEGVSLTREQRDKIFGSV